LSIIQSFQRTVYITFLAVVFAIGLAAYIAIKHLVAEQSRIQLQAISPVFTLVVDEIIKPQHLSQFLANSPEMIQLLDQQEVDKDALVKHLAMLEQQYDLTFFAASDNMMRQYFSSGENFALDDKIEWYHRVKESGQKFAADLGKRDDVHLYIDVAIENAQGKFLGFVGIGKSLKSFWQDFQGYKQKYGYDMIFVDKDHKILLSSELGLMGYRQSVIDIHQLDWYQELQAHKTDDPAIESNIVNINDVDFLVSEMSIESFGWTLLLLSPLEARQSDMTQDFMQNAALFLLILLSVLLVILVLFKRFRRGLEDNIHIDPLTQLANRSRVQYQFEQIKKEQMGLGLILLDLDHFKQVNDTYGHNAGDEVLKHVAETLSLGIREADVVGRWGGEEFIMLLPGASLELAEGAAERVRRVLEQSEVMTDGTEITVTASFGVTYAKHYTALADLVATADKALYLAKESGRNQVRTAV